MSFFVKEEKSADVTGELHDNQTTLYEKVASKIPNLASIKPIDKETYLWQLLEYVDTMVSGDDIQQIASYNYSSKTAQKALRELSQSIQIDLLSYYREKRDQLKDEIAALEITRQECMQNVETLQTSQQDLESEVDALGSKLAKIKNELAGLRTNGLAQVKKEIKAKKQEFSNELDLLRKESKSLQQANEEIKKSISTYNSTTMNLLDNNEVVWEPVSRTDAIYQVTLQKVREYVDNVKKAYMTKMGISKEECDTDFTLNSPSLEMLVNLLNSFSNEYISWPVSAIVDYDWSTYSNQLKVKAISDALCNIKMPKVKKKEPVFNKRQVPNGDVESLLRDLYLQKLLIESATRERVLEAELSVVVQVLKQYAPVGIDYIISAHGTFDQKFIKLLNEDASESPINPSEFHI